MKNNTVFVPGMMCDEQLFEEQVSSFCDNFKILIADQ